MLFILEMFVLGQVVLAICENLFIHFRFLFEIFLQFCGRTAWVHFVFESHGVKTLITPNVWPGMFWHERIAKRNTQNVKPFGPPREV